MANPIDSKTKRARLAARREPYWVQLRAGSHLGFRKLGAGEGTWVAKWRDPATGKRHYQSLGTLLDVETMVDSRQVVEARNSAFERARRAAESWLGERDAGVRPHSKTVRDACDDHVNAIRANEGDIKADAELARLQRLVFQDEIAGVELGRLRKEVVDAWRTRLIARPARVDRRKGEGVEPITRKRSPSTVNRDMVPLRAALNRAYTNGLISTDIAWRSALKPIENADSRREIYLDRTERKRMLEKATVEIAPFLRALSLLPLRPGAMAKLVVADFEPRLRSLRIGIDKKKAERRITVPETTAAFLKAQCTDKLPAAPIFSRADGSAWGKDSWKGPIKDAIKAAKLPAKATAYALRHSTITDLVAGGLDLLTVAQISATSVALIERHYSHLTADRAAAALARLDVAGG